MTGTITPPATAPTSGKVEAFSWETDSIDEVRWSELMAEFGDANLYQTWPYGVVRSGEANVRHLVLRQGATVRAMVQARIAKIPALPIGLAYVLWGPMWQRRSEPADPENFRQAVRSMRTEFALRGGLVVRLAPNLFASSNPELKEILESEGYVFQNAAPRRRTLLMSLEPSLDELQRGLHQKWRYHLNKSRKQSLEIVEGEENDLFEAFRRIFGEMVDRKQLANFTGPDACQKAQPKLRPREKVRVFLCKAEGEVCAGGICAALGDTGIYLFGATSNRGIKCYASYLTHWRMLEWVKERGCRWYDLNGINPDKNPGGFQFKTQLAGTHGRDETLLGQFDAYPNRAMKWLVPVADRLRDTLKRRRG